MPKVNFIREYSAFMEYSADNDLSVNEISLWCALFHCINARANGNIWPDAPVNISNRRLLLYFPQSIDTLERTRKSLVDRGLIQYTAGKKGESQPSYQLVYFAPELSTYCPQQQENPQDYPQDCPQDCPQDYPQDYPQDCPQDYPQDCPQDYPQDCPQDYPQESVDFEDKERNEKYTGNGRTLTNDNVVPFVTPFPADDDDKLSSAEEEDARVRMVQLVQAAYRKAFGHRPTSAEAESIAETAIKCKISHELIGEMLNRAATNGARNPASYCARIAGTWYAEEIRTLEELTQYDTLFRRAQDDPDARWEMRRQCLIRRVNHGTAAAFEIKWLASMNATLREEHQKAEEERRARHAEMAAIVVARQEA